MKPNHVVLTLTGIAIGVLLEKSIGPRQSAPPASSVPSHVRTPVSASRPAHPHGFSPGPAVGFYTAIAECAVADCEALAAEILALPLDSPHRHAALDLLMERWAEIDAPAALLFANTLRGDDRSQAFKSALLRLGEGRFEETFAWMNANLSVATRQEAQVWLFSGLAELDPLDSINRIANLGPGRLKEDALFTVVSRWAETDVNAAFAWFKTAPWTGRTIELYNRLMATYISRHPDQARTFISQLDGDDYWKGRYGQQLVSALAASDPGQALEVTRELPDDRRRDNSYTELFEQWSASDPQAAFTHALAMAADPTLPESTKNNVARQAAFAMLLEDHSKVLESYDQLPSDIRNEITGPIVSQWMSENPSAALAWAGRFDQDSQAFNLAMSAAAAHQEAWDPEAAIATAGRISYADIRRDSLYSALQHLYRQDPARAAARAADSNLVEPEIKASFDRWVAETGAAEMEFLSGGG